MTPVLGLAADHRAAEEVRGHRDVEHLADRRRRAMAGTPVRSPSRAASRRIASCPAGIQVGLGSPWPCRDVSRSPPSSPRPCATTVSELSQALHDQADDGALAPAPHRQRPGEDDRAADGLRRRTAAAGAPGRRRRPGWWPSSPIALEPLP